MNDFLKSPFGTRFHAAFETALLSPALENRFFDTGELLLGRFRINRWVAEGGMGVVYEAYDQRLDRRVAIKCAKTGFGNRLPPEARHAREISHPNVCRIFDIHTAYKAEGEIDFLTMEFLEGQTLAERLRAEPISASAARAIANQLCEGLAAAHRNHVIHGDLKSNNVILVAGAPETSNRAVITDFGLAHRPSLTGQLPDSPRMASAPVGGVPAYMAPELLRGARATAASDVYALGVMLRELSASAQLAESGNKLPARWNAAIARCLSIDPARRFADGDALRKALHPPVTRRWMVAAAAIVAALASGVVTFQKTTGPIQTVRLSMLPFKSVPEASDSAARLSRDTAAQLAQLRGNSKTRFVFVADKIPAARAGSYVLQGTLEAREAGTQNESDVLRIYLTERQSGINKKEWIAHYRPAELRYAPVALAGVISESLDLPHLVTQGSTASSRVNAISRNDYWVGMFYVNGDVQPDKAVRYLERAVGADPDSALAYAGLAEAQVFQGRTSGNPVWTEKARESVRQAELRDPDLPEVHLISGWMQKTLGHYEVAETHLLRAIELQRDNPVTWRRLGQTYYISGRANEALGALRKAVQLEPGGFRNHRELGIYYYRRNDFTDAVAEFRKMQDLAPSVAEPHSLLGETYYNMAKYPEAESELRTAIRLHDTANAEQTLGAVFWEQKRDKKAVECYLKAFALGRETSSLWLSVSFYYLERGFVRKAQNAFRRGLSASGKALAGDPRSGREHATQAYFEARLHELDRAESDADEALKFSQDDETIQLAVLTYEFIGRREAALSLLEGSPSVNELRIPKLDVAVSIPSPLPFFNNLRWN